MTCVVGFFINNLEDLKVFGTRVLNVVNESPSCEHLTVEQCVRRIPKFCPECGKMTSVLPGKVEEIKEKCFIGYKNAIFKECPGPYFHTWTKLSVAKKYLLKNGMTFTSFRSDHSSSDCIIYKLGNVELGQEFLSFQTDCQKFCDENGITGEFRAVFAQF